MAGPDPGDSRDASASGAAGAACCISWRLRNKRVRQRRPSLRRLTHCGGLVSTEAGVTEAQWWISESYSPCQSSRCLDATISFQDAATPNSEWKSSSMRGATRPNAAQCAPFTKRFFVELEKPKSK